MKSPTRNAGETRERILAAARRWFSRDNYQNVGIRDIAADAGVDAALVNRYFGSKEKLFAEVLEGGFLLEEHLAGDLGDFGAYMVAQIMADAEPQPDREFDALRVLLRAAGSQLTAPIVAERFHAEFVQPLAARLRGPDAELRAALVASYIIGLATMRHALLSPFLPHTSLDQVAARAGRAIQACIDS